MQRGITGEVQTGSKEEIKMQTAKNLYPPQRAWQDGEGAVHTCPAALAVAVGSDRCCGWSLNAHPPAVRFQWVSRTQYFVIRADRY